MYTDLSAADRLKVSIQGVVPTQPGGPLLLDICERYHRVLPWSAQAFNYTTRFEKLVGPRAGGSREAQLAELEKIAQHLDIQHSPAVLDRVAEEVYGGTSTFRKGLRGQIGDWRQHFTEEHRGLLKQVAGRLLIELGYERDLDW